ncbi:MAG: molybdopterin-dependent oxidoreductase [Gammaproteobacteria bacterium]|nr:molybdopterin-dependent oxidoreductase [Gammaproteobacteria bacterium]
MSKPIRIQSTCPHDCPSVCALEVEKLDKKTIGRVYGAKDNSYTSGTLCAKVGNYAERVHHPDRLQSPLKRIGKKGKGIEVFSEITWEEALDEVATRFQEQSDKYGKETVWPHFYAGTMGLVQRDGIERLRHAMGYSRQHSTICSAASDAGWKAGTGVKRGVDAREIGEHSDVVVLWGTNAVHTQVNLMHHVAQAGKRGCKLVVVDPYRNATAKRADLHIMLQPGSDGALATAMMHVLLKENLADREYLAEYTDFNSELESHLADKTPEWAAEITGVPVATIIEFARLVGQNKKTYYRFGYGFTRSRNGAFNMHAASCLPAMTGAWQYKGGGALYSNSELFKLDKTLIMGTDAIDPKTRILDQSRIGEILCGNPIDLQGGPPITALLIQNTNPMMVSPSSLKVKKGFERDDLFICVHEQFMTETAAMADIVLPATTFLEHEDIYVAGGHTFLQVAKPVIEPYANAKPNHYVICELAKRLGAKHAGFEMSTWEIIDTTLKNSGFPDAETIYQQKWLDCVRDFEEAHFLNGFETPDKKFHFAPDWSRLGKVNATMPTFPDHYSVTDKCSEEKPFRLITAPARQFLNSSFTETPTSQRREGRPSAKIHSSTCAALGLEDDGLVRIGNEQASVLVHVEVYDDVQKDVVIVESIWPNNKFVEGVGINSLVSSDPGHGIGGAVFHDTAVWLQPHSH